MFVFAGAVVSPAVFVGRLEGLSKWRAAAVALWSANLLVVPQLRTDAELSSACILVEMVCGHRVSDRCPKKPQSKPHRPSLLGTSVPNYGPSFRRSEKRRAAARWPRVPNKGHQRPLAIPRRWSPVPRR